MLHGYDGAGRWITENPQTGTVTDLYYSAAWQVLEEKHTTGGTTTVYAQYVWSPIYVDALILRDKDTNANGQMNAFERTFVTADANFNG